MQISRSHQSLLIATLLFTNLLVMGLTVDSLVKSRNLYVQRAEALTQNVANAVEQSLSGTVDKVDLALLSIVDDLESQLQHGPLNVESTNAFLARLESRLPEVDGFRASNASGVVYIGNGIAPGPKPTNGDRDYFLHHKHAEARTLYITKPVWGRIVNRHIIILSRRYNLPDGRFAGVVHATMSLEHIAKLISHYDLGKDGTVIVRDADLGLIVRHPARPGQPAGTVGNNQVSAEFMEAYRTGQNSAHFETSSGSDGLSRIFTFQRVSRAPMVVNVGVSTEAYLANWTSSAYKSIVLTGGFVVMSLLMGLGLLRLLNRMQKESVRNRVYLQHASDGVQIVDATGKVVEANERFCSMTGYDRETLLAMSPREWASCWPDIAKDRGGLEKMLSAPSGYTLETAVRCRDGHMLNVEINCSGFALGAQRFAYASVRDITERRAASDKIEQLAFYDPLTQLPNRRLLLDRLSQALASSAKHRHHGALMMIDIDNFKNLNDSYGHDVGDQFLKEVARRIQSAVSKGDTAARFGGDEFIVMLENLGDATAAALAAETTAENILRQLREPYLLKLQAPQQTMMERSHHCTSSIGVTLFIGQSDSPDELMKRADTAMYQAKSAGRDTLRFFDPQMQASVAQRASMEADLRHALDDKQFALHYQPQVDYRNKCFGVEALLRWQHPVRGLVSPAEFIPLAEETALILPLGKWVMDTACAQIQAWGKVPGMDHLTVSINVSARQFHQADFVDQVLDTLANTGVPPGKLKLELTETLFVNNIEDVIAKMNTLQSHGIGFSLDDFGTGYSSLSYLKRMPLQQLKIDRSFVRDITTDSNDAAISKTIVALADSLGLKVIAEGVETHQQRNTLAEYGCLNYQGYLFSKPLPAQQLELSLTSSR